LACSNEADKLAKKRIFSQEDPPLAVAAAREVVQAGELSTQVEQVQRIIGMGIAETTERLGAHQFVAKLRMEWQGNHRKQALAEERVLLSAEGGVSGDFHARLRNERGQGYDILRIGHQVFAKNQHGVYRQRLRDRGMAERMRQESFGVLGEIDNLFEHRMLLRADGKEVLEGREAYRYLMVLGESPRAEKAERLLPPKLLPKRDLSESSQLRLAFFERRIPEALEGKLWVDAGTAVVLKAELQGTLKVPEGEAVSTVRLRLATRVEQIGKTPQLTVPETFVPDEDKPQGIAAALERFGFGRKTRTEADSPEAPPDEEE
jgi:predicted GNAT family acetyltransferase